MEQGTQAEVEAWLLTFPLFATTPSAVSALFDLCSQR
jgi:hypothetical protein